MKPVKLANWNLSILSKFVLITLCNRTPVESESACGVKHEAQGRCSIVQGESVVGVEVLYVQSYRQSVDSSHVRRAQPETEPYCETGEEFFSFWNLRGKQHWVKLRVFLFR